MTDTAAIQRTKEGVRTAAVSIPVRYPRTPSGVTCLRDAEAALALTGPLLDIWQKRSEPTWN